MSTTYSFLDNIATLTGPSGSVSLGYGSGDAEEGITVTPSTPINEMTIGADGSGMHSLRANKSGKVTVRLLRTAPVNFVLMTMYNAQTAASTLHGKNLINIVNIAMGDDVSCSGVAFAKVPDLSYGAIGNYVEWEFDSIKIIREIGATLL